MKRPPFPIILAVNSEVPTGEHRFEVPEELHEERLDRALVALVPGYSRSRLQQLVRDQHVRVDGLIARRPSAPVAAGCELVVDLPPRYEATTAAGEPVAGLVVVYEDEHLAVIDKPAGLVAHPNERFQTGTVSELAVARWGSLPEVQGEDRPGIVHRLDRMTSGLMLIGRTHAALRRLKEQFQERAVEKTYVALCHGSPRFHSEWIEVPIERHPRTPERLRAATEGTGREAQTYIECVERFHGFARVIVQPKTGRTHQIRVHLHHMGLPIVGDRVYRHPGALAVPLADEAPQPHRQALHAAAIAFEHPVSGEWVRFESPLPGDMQALLDWLRAEHPERAE